MRNSWLPLLAAALLLLSQALVADGNGAEADLVHWSEVDKPVVPFSLQDLDGHRLSTDDLSGKIVILDFWATWCGPCKQELPELAIYAERIKDSEEVEFLSLNVTDLPEDLRVFATENDITYPIYSGDDLLEPYGVYAFPTKLILDLRGDGPGEVLYRHFGFTGLAGIEDQISRVLAE